MSIDYGLCRMSFLQYNKNNHNILRKKSTKLMVSQRGCKKKYVSKDAIFDIISA